MLSVLLVTHHRCHYSIVRLQALGKRLAHQGRPFDQSSNTTNGRAEQAQPSQRIQRPTTRTTVVDDIHPTMGPKSRARLLEKVIADTANITATSVVPPATAPSPVKDPSYPIPGLPRVPASKKHPMDSRFRTRQQVHDVYLRRVDALGDPGRTPPLWSRQLHVASWAVTGMIVLYMVLFAEFKQGEDHVFKPIRDYLWGRWGRITPTDREEFDLRNGQARGSNRQELEKDTAPGQG